jgi:ATP phosphoribosyltransferase
MPKWDNNNTKDLFKAILALKNSKEAKQFFRDLLTEKELIEFGNRWKAAQMLDQKKTYVEIEKETGLSSTTIARISKWLNKGMGGYKMMLQKKKYRIAIQSKGRLRDHSINFLKSQNLDLANVNGRNLISSCKNANIEIVDIRHGDIPWCVQEGIVDFGIVGKNAIYEKECKVHIVKELGFGKCSVVIAVPKNSKIKSIKNLQKKRIATSYPKTLKQFLEKKNIQAGITTISGSVEVAPSLGLVDAICDITQTGRTLEEHNLVPIETVLESEAVLIQSPFVHKQSFDKLLSSLSLQKE